MVDYYDCDRNNVASMISIAIDAQAMFIVRIDRDDEILDFFFAFRLVSEAQ